MYDLGIETDLKGTPPEETRPHDGEEYAFSFGRYTIGTIVRHTTFSSRHRDKIVGDLSRGMPGFDVEEYFGNQPTVFSDYDFLTIARESQENVAIGLIGARWLQAGERRILYLWTAMLADAYRSTKLYPRMTSLTMAAVLRENDGLLPELIVTKTYNPRVFALLRKYFERAPGASVYPRIPGPQSVEAATVAGAVAAALWPAMPFDAETAVLRGGQAAVSPNFFPLMERCGQQAIDTHFASSLTRNDQVVCLVQVPEAASRHISSALLRAGQR